MLTGALFGECFALMASESWSHSRHLHKCRPTKLIKEKSVDNLFLHRLVIINSLSGSVSWCTISWCNDLLDYIDLLEVTLQFTIVNLVTIDNKRYSHDYVLLLHLLSVESLFSIHEKAIKSHAHQDAGSFTFNKNLKFRFIASGSERTYILKCKPTLRTLKFS